MTAKDKAKELVNRFLQIYEGRVPQGKQCALICVDEILREIPKRFDSEERYWEKVKQEIENLEAQNQAVTLTDVVSTFTCDTCKDKGSIAYWHKTGMGIKPCKCRKTN